MKTTNDSHPLMTPQQVVQLQLTLRRARPRWLTIVGSFIFCLLLTGEDCACAQTNYSPYTISTVAGKAMVGGYKDGTNSEARFFYPSGVAVDSAGNIYVGDTKLDVIRKVTAGGVVTTLAGGHLGSADGTGTNAQFFGPVAVEVDSASNVYVADSQNYTIRKITPDGVVTTLAGLAGYRGTADGTNSDARFWDPSGVAVDKAGILYVADSANRTIRQVTPDGVVSTLAGRAEHSGSADGTGTNALFGRPTGVAVDNVGNVYVADRDNHTIRKVTAGGVVTTLAGLAGSYGSVDGTGSAARFHFPSDVAVDSAGNVYVADNNNETIRRVTPGGVVTTLAGLAEHTGSADGTGSAARFASPRGVAVDDAGNLYVADFDNDTIRKGSPALILEPYFLAGGDFHLLVVGPPGSEAVISVSTNLRTWEPVLTNFLTGGYLNFTDTSVSNFHFHFYRAKLK